MRSPLQGGLPPVGAVDGPVVEIACDESGFSGTNLLHSTAPIITHASVDLTADEAVAVIAALQSGFRVSPHEFKSGQLLRRPGAGAALDWFLAALAGRAHVHLIDKEFFLVTRIVDLLLHEPSYRSGTSLTQDQRAAALALYRNGRVAGEDWSSFLAAFVELARVKRRTGADGAVERFLRAADRLGVALDGLNPDRVKALRDRWDDDDRSIPPPLEPLLPALAETVLFWSGGRRRVLVTHDEQSALTADRLTRLQQALAAGRGVSPLAGLVMVDSRDDPRVQVADLLAGVARRSPALISEATTLGAPAQ